MAISVNMLRLRVTSDCQPRWKNGQPAHTTTGVARASCSQVPRLAAQPVIEAQVVPAHRQEHNRQRQGEPDPEAAGHVAPLRIGRCHPPARSRARAPCRRSDSCRGRSGGYRDASGRYRPHPAARPALPPWLCCRPDSARDRPGTCCGSRRSRNGSAPRHARPHAWPTGDRLSCRRRDRAPHPIRQRPRHGHGRSHDGSRDSPLPDHLMWCPYSCSTVKIVAAGNSLE